MPNFKTGLTTAPPRAQGQSATLDTLHQEKLESFSRLETEVIPGIESELVEARAIARDPSLPFDKRLAARDRARSLKRKLRSNQTTRRDYYLENAKHIFSYFENKKLTSQGRNQTRVLDAFFKKRDASLVKHQTADSSSREYIANLDNTQLDLSRYTKDIWRCSSCGKGEMVPIEHEGVRVCSSCSRSEKFLIEHEKPSYKEPPQEVCFYAYKRINHFREILAQFQAKETTQIPDVVLSDIKAQIKKERIDLSHLTNRRTKEILKKLGYNKYYEHIPFIKDKLGIRPPVMSPELEDTLCNLFLEIQAPYAKFCPDDRVNFLNYYYTVYKLCELLDEQRFLPFFPMLKDRDKRIEQDEIWRKICDELDWEFIPTV